MDTKNSLTTLLNDLLKLQNNSYQIISAVSDLVTSKSETIQIPVLDANGVVQSVAVPSFGAIKDQLVRIESDIKSITGIGETNSSIRLADGTFRKILINEFQREANDVANMVVPKSFSKRENWFFESFLNPLLYVTFDLTNQVKYNTENVEVSRYILNIDTDTKKKIFNETFASKADIDYQAFAKVLVDNNITYFLDKDITALPPRNVRYYGSFAVNKITDDTITETIDNVTYSKKAIRVTLDTLNYNDSQSEFLRTSSIKIGDSLIVNSEKKNTRYEVLAVDASTRTVSLRLIEGFEPILIGANSVSIYSASESPVTLNVNIGFSEYAVMFIKPIDPDSKISAINWSPGVGIFTNDLRMITSTGEEVSLATYYQNEVVDFGSYLYSLAKDNIIPTSLGITPNAPVLNADNFKVLQINQHITDTSVLTDLKKLQSDKLRIQSDINSVDSSVKNLRNKLQTTKYTTNQLKASDQSTLQTLIKQRESLSSLFASTIDDINKIAVSNTVSDLTPKYRVRGFFPIPEPKTSTKTGAQNVVQFSIEYRYLSKDGGANQPDQITFKDNNGAERRGTFPTWVPIKSDVRKRITDATTGNTTWIVEDVENADQVNINCVDIAISQGEAVEFRIKSLSESGWPVSPKESDWSEIIRVDFPTEFESQPDVNSILQQAQDEKVRIELQKEIDALGIKKHVANSFEQNSKYFAHNATEIASGFLSAEQNVIALFDKLISMETQISDLKSMLESSRGVLVVKIVDDAGQEYKVENNSVVSIFAGNYRDEVASKTIKKGIIISKNYFVKLFNDSASNLEMYARYWGSRKFKSQESWFGGDNYNGNDTDYNLVRRYDRVPLGLTNPLNTDVSTYGYVRNFPDQSSQVLGQFIQSRYISIDGQTKLYGDCSKGSTAVYTYASQIAGLSGATASTMEDLEWNLDKTIQDNLTLPTTPAGSIAAGDFIWKGGTGSTSSVIPITNAIVVANYDNTILAHINHPGISSWSSKTTSNAANLAASREVRNSKFGNLPIGSTGDKLQTPLFFEGTGATSNRYSKVCFDSEDQYLLGPKSVGSYLFLNPSSHSDVTVNGSDSLSVRRIGFGDSQSIAIPVTFQYRMTDYFGTGDAGLGNVGGKRGSSKNDNLTYTKRVGIDIYNNPINKERFSFDLEITARYYSRTIVGKDIPTKTWAIALDQLNNTIRTVNPTTTRDLTPIESRSSVTRDQGYNRDNTRTE
jgi:hypothetical protein